MRNRTNKKLQSKVNKVIRDLNKNIYNDDLWLGRFFAYQVSSKYYHFEDNSGGEIYVHIRLVDKKTWQTEDIWLGAFTSFIGLISFTSNLFWNMNDFIVEITKEEENIYKNRVNYRKVKNKHVK